MRVWVDSKKRYILHIRGTRRLDLENRTIFKYDEKEGWQTFYSNQTCMRFIEVIIFDTGKTEFI